MLLTHDDILDLYNSRKLEIRPLLDKKQISESTIDLRLGGDFQVAIQGRGSHLHIAKVETENTMPVSYYFQPTRRKFGDTFLLHPFQTVLAASLEYIKLPDDVMMMLQMRSSYARLGLTISTIVQPGYRGCISLELTNSNKNIVNLTVGARLFQGVFFQMNLSTDYLNKPRKYLCAVRPQISSAEQDDDLVILQKVFHPENAN